MIRFDGSEDWLLDKLDGADAKRACPEWGELSYRELWFGLYCLTRILMEETMTLRKTIPLVLITLSLILALWVQPAAPGMASRFSLVAA